MARILMPFHNDSPTYHISASVVKKEDTLFIKILKNTHIRLDNTRFDTEHCIPSSGCSMAIHHLFPVLCAYNTLPQESKYAIVLT